MARNIIFRTDRCAGEPAYYQAGAWVTSPGQAELVGDAEGRRILQQLRAAGIPAGWDEADRFVADDSAWDE